jgi:hypothetical protein
MAPGLSMSRGIFSFRRGAVMVFLLAAVLPWPQRAGADDWAEGNYRDRHYENDLYRAGVAVDTGSLIKAVQGDAREDVRRWAAIVLGRRLEDSAGETLWSVAHRDGSAEVRKEALLALARLGEASVLPALEQIMREGGSPLSGPYLLAAQLAELGDVSGYEYVEREATAASPMRRRQSVYLLREFLPYRHKGTLASDPFQRLVALTHDPDRSVREDAVMGFEWAWWQGVSIEEIRKAMSWMLEQKEDPELGEVARRHLNTIESYQQDVDAGRIKRPQGR